MSNLVVHPLTDQQIKAFQSDPAQAVVLVGPAGSGKRALAEKMVETVLELSAGGLEGYVYKLIVQPEEGKKTIGIESARELERFLSLTVPGSRTAYNRVVLIENSQLLTLEAQSSLLKILEEPPAGTFIILTASHEQALLPTVRSRLQQIAVKSPDHDALKQYFAQQGLDGEAIARSHAISGGLPGLMSALLEEDEHPLLEATEEARQLLSRPMYERLTLSDGLSKKKELAIDTIKIMQQMARVSLTSAQGPAAARWQAVLKASYEALEALDRNAQPKLVLTNLLLQF